MIFVHTAFFRVREYWDAPYGSCIEALGRPCEVATSEWKARRELHRYRAMKRTGGIGSCKTDKGSNCSIEVDSCIH